jgi:hypothetical protein
VKNTGRGSYHPGLTTFLTRILHPSFGIIISSRQLALKAICQFAGASGIAVGLCRGGLNWGNGLQVGTGLLGLGGNYTTWQRLPGIGSNKVLGSKARSGTRYDEVFDEYMYFRNQGFTATQAWYLTQPYTGVGHHFPITQRTARRWGLPDWLRDSPFNVLKPRKISRGRFYELHYTVDPDFHGTAFPRCIGGSWRGGQLGLKKYSP